MDGYCMILSYLVHALPTFHAFWFAGSSASFARRGESEDSASRKPCTSGGREVCMRNPRKDSESPLTQDSGIFGLNFDVFGMFSYVSVGPFH